MIRIRALHDGAKWVAKRLACSRRCWCRTGVFAHLGMLQTTDGLHWNAWITPGSGG